jgi:hypothetical protein
MVEHFKALFCCVNRTSESHPVASKYTGFGNIKAEGEAMIDKLKHYALGALFLVGPIALMFGAFRLDDSDVLERSPILEGIVRAVEALLLVPITWVLVILIGALLLFLLGHLGAAVPFLKVLSLQELLERKNEERLLLDALLIAVAIVIVGLALRPCAN